MTRSGILTHALPVAVTRVRAALNQDLKGLVPHAGVEAEYVALALRRFEDEILQTCTKHGTTVQSVEFPRLLRFCIPLALPGEQRRIVAAVEESFTRLDNAVASLKRVQVNVKRYRASVLEAAFEGKLVPSEAELARTSSRTYEHAENLLSRLIQNRRSSREVVQLPAGHPPRRIADDHKSKSPDQSLTDTRRPMPSPEGWTWANVDQISVVVRGASPRPAGDPRFFGGAIPWITVGALTADEQPYLRSVNLTVTELGKRASRYIDAGTLLLTNSGATLGVPKITLIGGCINDGSVALLGVEDPLKLYLYYFLRSQTRKLRGINQGAAQPNLNTSIVKAINVPLPPTAEQIRITAELERRLSLVNGLELAIQNNLKRANRLRRAVLKRAFEGKLVPQDPFDDPASASVNLTQAYREADVLNRSRRSRSSANNGDLFVQSAFDL